MMTDPFEEVRSAAAEVAASGRHVVIDRSRISTYAQRLAAVRPDRPTLDASCHHLGRGEATLAFVLVLDTVNFGSGWFPHLRKRPGMSGYFTIASGLADRFRDHGAPAADELAVIKADECGRWFGQDPADGTVMELMGFFARALNDLGRMVAGRYGGRYAALVEDADGSAAGLVSLLRQMPFFDDVAVLDGRPVPFLKRAQLTVADLALAFGGEGWGRFDDLSRLTMFADNLVPHVLRVDGVLNYDPDLAARIDAGVLIESGSREEIELRASALHAVECLAGEMVTDGCGMTAMELDFLLWNRGQDPAYKQAKPRHRTRSVFY